jgi:orotate phosphoribosyltransferase
MGKKQILAESTLTMKKELIRLLLNKSFLYSDEPKFKLVSGRFSNYYVNCRPTASNARGAYLIGCLIFHLLRGSGVRAVGGLETGANPVSSAASLMSEILGASSEKFNSFWIRKAQKDHGVVKWIEGDVSKGDQVAIVDDVATTGGSTITAIERARAEGLDVVKVVILVDRQEGGLENIRKYVDDVSAIVTREELMAHRI